MSVDDLELNIIYMTYILTLFTWLTFNILFTWKTDSQRKESQKFHPLIHSFNGCNSWSWDSLEPGTFYRSPKWYRRVGTGTSHCCFPNSISRQQDHRWSSPNWNRIPCRMLASRQKLSLLCHWTSPLFMSYSYSCTWMVRNQNFRLCKLFYIIVSFSNSRWKCLFYSVNICKSSS